MSGSTVINFTERLKQKQEQDAAKAASQTVPAPSQAKTVNGEEVAPSNTRDWYQSLVGKHMRGVVRDVLGEVAKSGLMTESLYVRFNPFGNETVPANWADKQDMTLVFQHQFDNLAVTDEKFTVDMWFDGRCYTLVVPFDKVLSFVDPATKFGMEF